MNISELNKRPKAINDLLEFSMKQEFIKGEIVDSLSISYDGAELFLTQLNKDDFIAIGSNAGNIKGVPQYFCVETYYGGYRQFSFFPEPDRDYECNITFEEIGLNDATRRELLRFAGIYDEHK